MSLEHIQALFVLKGLFLTHGSIWTGPRSSIVEALREPIFQHLSEKGDTMNKQFFEHEMGKAQAMRTAGDRPDYWAGYMRGLRRKYHGENFGTIFFIGQIGASIGPVTVGYIFDVTGSYQLGFIILSIASILATLIMIGVKTK